MARMFGTDGVRGVAGSELTIELATKLGQAGAYVLTKEQEHQATIIVGCDTRISGGMLASALMAGICSVGANAIFVGVMPTPAIAYLTRKHKVDAGVVISASHNPMEFNGIKFFNGEGYKLPDEMEDEIESLIKNNMKDVVLPIGSGVGKIDYRFDLRDLPLTDSLSLSKDLGTRHRAAVGISEVSDSLTIVVSEETGKVSIALDGELYRNVDAEFLKNKLAYIQKREQDTSKVKSWRRRLKDVTKIRKESNE